MTDFSHSCNNDHYWTIIIGGNSDLVTLDRNYIHDVSGRAPKIGSSEGTQIVQAVNNWFNENQGHNFDISSSGRVLIEGNYFSAAEQPLTSASEEGVIFNVPDGSGGTCNDHFGRDCETNQLDNSGDFASREDEEVLTVLAEHADSLVEPIPVGDVQQEVEANYGVGRI